MHDWQPCPCSCLCATPTNWGHPRRWCGCCPRGCNTCSHGPREQATPPLHPCDLGCGRPAALDHRTGNRWCNECYEAVRASLEHEEN